MSNQVFSNAERKYMNRQPNVYFVETDISIPALGDDPLTFAEEENNRGDYWELVGTDDEFQVIEEGIYSITATVVYNANTDPNVDRDIGAYISVSSVIIDELALTQKRQIEKGTDPGVDFYSLSFNATLYLPAEAFVRIYVKNLLPGVQDLVIRSADTDPANYTNILVCKIY